MFLDTYAHLASSIESNQRPETIALISHLLQHTRLTAPHWPNEITSFRKNPLFDTLSRDPMTKRSFTRPRGYPGDSGLIEIIYQRQPEVEPDPVGLEIFKFTVNTGVCEAVRERLEHAREQVSGAAIAGKRICSLACGHLREADEIGAPYPPLTAVDSDPRALDVIRRKHGENIEIVEANVFAWLRRAGREGRKFDLVYTLGLTDYLDDRQLALLTKLAKCVLAEGGRLLIANFLDHPFSGYMEAAMDWHLVYRTQTDMARNAERAGLNFRIYNDSADFVTYCEMWA